MNWTNPPATEKEPGYNHRPIPECHFVSAVSPATETPSPGAVPAQSTPSPIKPPELKIGKTFAASPVVGATGDLEVFTLTLGGETIELVPLKNWSQLDHYKWSVRGKLPTEPSGLEIAFDHVRIAGETVFIHDSAGCAKLERLFNEWLVLERETLELARKKRLIQPVAGALEHAAQPASQPPRFSVEVDKRGQVHVHCWHGKHTVTSVGLTQAGFHSLCQQGLMRRPHTVETGALHDWVELDGELFSFEKGQNDAVRLEQTLNERYLPVAAIGHGKEVVVFLNAASSSGFDIQFPVMVAGALDNHRHHLNEQSLELLQDPNHCGLLHKEIIVKLIPPNLVFKQKTPDGGEHNLPWNPENTVSLVDEAGQQKSIPLSQPLNLLRLSPAELTAVFNHPAINRHAKAAPPPRPPTEPQASSAAPGPELRTQPESVPPALPSAKHEALVETLLPASQPAGPHATSVVPPKASELAAAQARSEPPKPAAPLPNLWLHEILAQPALPHDWFAVLVYSKLAERFGNSNAGNFGPCSCWFISLGEVEDVEDPEFKGIFITEKGSLGFVNAGRMARFYQRIAFLGPQQYTLEGLEVDLVAVGLDARERLVFVLSDSYHSRFDVPDATVVEVLNRLAASGAVVMSVAETLASPDPLEVVWTVPADQPDPSSPEALESIRP